MGQIVLTRRATLIGNGAHIFVPKEWAGQEIVLTMKPEKPVRKRILEVLEPYLNDICGAFLFGSYARGEQTHKSDVDLLVLTSKKIKIRYRGFEIICIEEDKFENALKTSPVLLFSMLSEANAIINEGLLQRLKENFKPKLEDFAEFIEDTKRTIKINEDLIKSYQGKEEISDSASVYSLVLRLRGVFIINSLIKGENYSNKLFKEWVQHLSKIDLKEIYDVYLDQKRDLKSKKKIKTIELTNLLNLLKKEINKFK